MKCKTKDPLDATQESDKNKKEAAMKLAKIEVKGNDSKDSKEKEDNSKTPSKKKSKDSKEKLRGTTGQVPKESVTKDETPSKQSETKPVPPPLPLPFNLPIDPAKLLEDSRLKAEESKSKIDLKVFIKKHLLEGSKKMDYELGDLHALLDLAKYSFLKANTLLELNAPVNICGDIHGQYGDLMRIFNACGLPFRKKYLFLGDYVDRGRHSLEVICVLFALRVQFPRKVYLLRGNHELANINKVYGFLADIRGRFRAGNDWKTLYDHFNEVFAVMPLAALVSSKILCMHGGLSPDLNHLDDIRKLSRPITIARGLAQDLLWADPESGLKGFQVNKIRSVSHVFGEDAVASKCKQLNIDLVVRAHQVVEFGYAFFANRMLITVFSAARYHEDLWNFAAVVKVDEKLEISFAQLKPTEYEQVRREKQQQAQATGDPGDDEEEEKK